MVDDVQQAGQGGGLTGTGLTGDQDDALTEIGELLDLGRKTQLVKGGDVVVQDTDGAGYAALLAEQVHAAAGAVGEADGQILFADAADLIVMFAQFPGVGLAVGGGHDVVIQMVQMTVNTQGDGNTADNMNIAGPLFLGHGENFADGKQFAHEGQFSLFKYRWS